MAKASGASLRIMHVMYDPIVQADLPGYGYGGQGGTAESVLYHTEIDARKNLRHRLEYYETKAELDQIHLDISLILRSGFPESEIAGECRTWQPDLILMGTHGRGHVAQTLLGSVSARLIEQVPIPVLAIPREVSYQPISHILYASAMEARDGKNACAIMKLFEKFSPTVSCVNVCVDTLTKMQPWQYNTIREELEHLIRTDCAADKLRFDVLEGSKLDEQLNAYIEEHNMDILVMAMHHRNLLEKLFSRSQTKNMLSHSHIPLLAMHVGGRNENEN